MPETNLLQFSQPGTFADPLTEVFRNGARALLAQAVEAEVASLLERYADEVTDAGRQRLVRHGHLPEREIVTGLVQWRFVARACATVLAKGPSASGSRRRFCRPTRGGRRVSRC